MAKAVNSERYTVCSVQWTVNRLALCALILLALTPLAVAQYVTLTGTMQGSNGTPLPNAIIDFTPTQNFYVPASNTTQPVDNLTGSTAPSGSCVINGQLYSIVASGSVSQVYQCVLDVWVALPFSGGCSMSGSAGTLNVSNGTGGCQSTISGYDAAAQQWNLFGSINLQATAGISGLTPNVTITATDGGTGGGNVTVSTHGATNGNTGNQTYAINTSANNSGTYDISIVNAGSTTGSGNYTFASQGTGVNSDNYEIDLHNSSTGAGTSSASFLFNSTDDATAITDNSDNFSVVANGYVALRSGDAAHLLGNGSQICTMATGCGGNGTVNSGIAHQIAYYATGGTAVSGSALTVDSGGNLAVPSSVSVGGTISGTAVTIGPHAPPASNWTIDDYSPATVRTSIGAAGSGANSDITSLAGLTTPLTVAQGGTGTSTPSLVAGTNIIISGSWPNQTINAAAPYTLPFVVAHYQTTAATTSTTTFTTTLPAVGTYRVSAYAVATISSANTLSGTFGYTDSYGVQSATLFSQELIVGQYVQGQAIFFNATANASFSFTFTPAGGMTYIPQAVVIEELN